MLFALLKAAIQETNTETEHFETATTANWLQCYKLAVLQGVKSIAWDGICKLPIQLQPYKALKIQWFFATEQDEKKYSLHCKTVHHLLKYLASEGIDGIQMKGVALSGYYPIPSHREGGDIDIYTYSANKEKMTDNKANTMTDQLMQRKGIKVNLEKYKHSEFYYNGVMIENHKEFLNIKELDYAKKVNQILHEILQPTEILIEGNYKIKSPDPLFNEIFVIFHSAQHYCDGLSIHHLLDWTCLIKNYGIILEGNLDDCKFKRFIGAMTTLSNRLLGTSIEIEKDDEEMVVDILEDMIRCPFDSILVPRNSLKRIIFKIKKMIYAYKKRRKVFDVSLWKIIVFSLKYHIKKPESI